MKNSLTFFVTLFLITASFSQAKKKETTPATETSSKIRVFTPSSQKYKEDNSYKWAVKTDFFSIITGEFPIIAEYRLGSKFSIEGSAAVTYGYLSNEAFNSLNDDGEGDYLESNTPEMGSAFRASFKYFPSSDYDAIEGWYFGVQLMNKTTNRSYEESSSYVIDGKETKVKTGASIIIGKQVFQDSNVLWDFYFGAGIASTTHTFHKYDYNSDTGIETIYQDEVKKSKPNILFGLRVGFGN